MATTQGYDDRLLARVEEYIERLFQTPDPALSQALKDAEAAGLPAIQVSPNQGAFLNSIARIAGARRILEIGTLGGYSTIWLARALPAEGKLITLELNPKHAEVARRNLERAGLSGRVEIRLGDAKSILAGMRGESPFDLVFIDADKPGYPKYLELVLPLSRPGTVILADNLIRDGLVLEDAPSDPDAAGARAFNQAIASHPRLDSIILTSFKEKVDGISLSIVK
jgi:predicted O-methyltransferase YrrM